MSRATLGNFRSLGGGSRNILSVSYGFTNTKKVVGTASTTAIHAAITGSSSTATTVTTSITDPDVPRALTVTAGGTASDIAAGNVTITGTNVEGKIISETFAITVDTAGTTTGTKAFKTVTSIAIPQQDGAAATFAVGTSTKIGLNHRLATTASTATVKVVSITSAGVKTLQSTPTTLAASATLVESNTVIPATVPDGTTAYSIHYFFYNWGLDPVNGNPSYGA
jgi:hypothetical protein